MSDELTKTDLKKLSDLMESFDKHLVKSEPGDYVELLDENDPNSTVQFKRKNGSSFLEMPLEAYQDLLNYKITG